VEQLITAIQKMPEVYNGITKDGSWFAMGFDPDTCFCAMVVNGKNCYSRSFRDQYEWEIFKTDIKELLL
jgi:hypothetical protein